MRPPYTGEETINFKELSVNVENIKVSVLTDKGLFDEMREEGQGQGDTHVHAYYEAFLVREGHLPQKPTDAALSCTKKRFRDNHARVYIQRQMQGEDSRKRYSLGLLIRKTVRKKRRICTRILTG